MINTLKGKFMMFGLIVGMILFLTSDQISIGIMKFVLVFALGILIDFILKKISG